MEGKKIILTVLAVLLLGITDGNAAEPARFRFGADWGLAPQVFHTSQSTYITRIGYRVTNPFRQECDYYTNGYMTFNAGLEFARHFAIYAKTGWLGLSEDFRVMPLMAEAQFFTRSYMVDSPFMMVYGGTGLHDAGFDDKTLFAGFGCGYRHCLSHKISIDAVVRVQWSGFSPLPEDEFEGVVPRERIVFSYSNSIAVGFGLSLNF